MYSKLKQLKKFTTKVEIDNIIGNPKFQIGNQLVYYYGNGMLVAYSLRRFRIVGCERIEYGQEGVYAISLYHFADIEMLKEYFRLDSFEVDDMEGLVNDVIDGEVTYNKTFTNIHNMNLKLKYADSYMEGEAQVLINGKMKVRNLFISYGTFTLFFRGKSKKSKVSGFEYSLHE